MYCLNVNISVALCSLVLRTSNNLSLWVQSIYYYIFYLSVQVNLRYCNACFPKIVEKKSISSNLFLPLQVPVVHYYPFCTAIPHFFCFAWQNKSSLQVILLCVFFKLRGLASLYCRKLVLMHFTTLEKKN